MVLFVNDVMLVERFVLSIFCYIIVFDINFALLSYDFMCENVWNLYIWLYAVLEN